MAAKTFILLQLPYWFPLHILSCRGLNTRYMPGHTRLFSLSMSRRQCGNKSVNVVFGRSMPQAESLRTASSVFV